MNEPRSMYAPYLTFPPGEPFYPPSSWTASVYEPYAEMSPYPWAQETPYVIAGAAPSAAPTLGHTIWGALQDAGHAIEQQLPSLGQSITHAADQPMQLLQTAAKANQASDAITQASEDAKRAIAEAQETVKTVKYIAFGIGGLAAVALVVSIFKNAT